MPDAPANANFQQALLGELLDFLQLLRDAASEQPPGVALLAEIGWNCNAMPGFPLAALASELQKIFALVNDVESWIEQPPKELGDLPRALSSVHDVLDAVQQLPAIFNGSGAAAPAGFERLPLELVEYLTLSYLQRGNGLPYSLLALLGIVRKRDASQSPPPIVTPDGQVQRTGLADELIDWTMIGRLLSDPVQALRSVYGASPLQSSAQAQLLVDALFPALAALGDSLGIQVFAGRSGAAPTDYGQLGNALLDKSITFMSPRGSIAGFGVRFSLVPADVGGLGLVIAPFGTLNGEWPLGAWKLAVRADASIDAVAIGSHGVLVASAAGGAEFSAGIDFSRPAAAGDALSIGSMTSTRLEVAGVSLGVDASFSSTARDYGVHFSVEQAKLVIAAGDGDGFLSSVLPSKGIELDFALGIGWTSSKGLYFSGGGGLDVSLPVHLSILDVLSIDSIDLALKLKADGAIGIAVAFTGGVELGPISATVESLGLQANIALAPGSGGQASLLAFKPPDGVGLAIDAGALQGGGHLRFDTVRGQYSGVLALSIQKQFQLKVIGILDTKMPDGSEGFSLLLIVSVEFSPIQLGYGFTLNGVGGLAAFNRTMILKALQDGVRNRTLDSIMFPPDPVANSSKIISDLQKVFPPATGRFVFAPMVKIGWGSSILLIEIGLAVELPSPLRLAIMGKVHLLLPPATADKSQEQRLPIELHMAVVGTLDFDQGEIYVTAALYNSFIAIFPVTGGMVTRIRWGRDPMFLLSVGGFNPRFTPPPGMDPVDRVGIQLSYDKEGIRAALRLESYFALTANSFQIGARLDAYAEVVGIATLRGYLGFDALIASPPFHFIVDVFGGVQVQAFGFGFACDLLLTLSGPGPVEGNGFVKVEFFGEHHVDVHFLIGEPAAEPPLPLVDPYEELVNALQDRRNWTAVLPDSSTMFVTLRKVAPDEAGQAGAGTSAPPPLLVHPLGELSVRQRVLPLGLRLERFGGATPSSSGPFKIASFDVGGAVVTPKEGNELRDAFARGQFSNLTEDQKLTLPAFEPMICGYQRVVTDEVSFGAQQEAEFEMEMIVIDDKAQPPSEPVRLKLLDDALARSTQCGAAKAMGVPPKNGGKYVGPSAGIKVKGPQYAVASSDTMKANGTTRYRTHAEAEADPAIGRKPARSYQVVEEYELA